MIEEIWKDIKGYEGLYQVSNLGRVKSFKGVSERILKPQFDNKGYTHVHLCKNSRRTQVTVHRLVAEAFIQNKENKPQVNHIDEDKTNNMVSNLEWMTANENNNHGTRTARTLKPIVGIDIANGETNSYSSVNQCAESLGLWGQNISAVLNNRLRQTGGYIFKYAN